MEIPNSEDSLIDWVMFGFGVIVALIALVAPLIVVIFGEVWSFKSWEIYMVLLGSFGYAIVVGMIHEKYRMPPDDTRRY